MLGRKPSAKFLSVFIVILAVHSLLGAEPAQAAAKAKNVIVLIVDGCSAEQYTLARWFKGAPLSFDPYQVGAVKTHIADSVIADSAPAASAFATGVRTSDKFISVGPRKDTLTGVPAPPEERRYRPLATVLEGAKLLKKATGIVATSRVTHATPAAYIAHTPSRANEDDIMEQAVYQGINVVFGGGRRHLVTTEFKGRRTDGDNLYAYLKNWGYAIVDDRDAMQATAADRVFGAFAHSHMDPEIDRPRLHPEQPTLEEMTRKAIEILSRDPDGFFLMVEGSQVDWACHANDPAHMLSDLLAYDKAVAAALDFAGRDGKTLVLAVSDHNTGGFSIGNYASDGIYPRMKVEDLLEPIRKMKSSAAFMWAQIEKEKSAARVRSVIKEGWSLDITDEEANRILDRAKQIYLFGLDHPWALRRRRAALCLRARQARRRCRCTRYCPRLRERHGVRPGKTEPAAFRRGRPGLRRRPCRRGQIRPGQPGGQNRLRRENRRAAGQQKPAENGRKDVFPGRGRGVCPRHRKSIHPPAGRSPDQRIQAAASKNLKLENARFSAGALYLDSFQKPN